MPIILRCDTCNTVLATHQTIGRTQPTTCIPDIEQRCAACSLDNLLASWPAKLNAIKSDFVANRMPEVKKHLEAMIRQKFMDYAKAGAQAHFGSSYDAALPSIQDEVLALKDTPMTITVTFGS